MRLAGVLFAPFVIVGAASMAVVAACSSGGLPSDNGVTEPIIVSGGQFVAGDLPGTPPDAGPEEGDAQPPLSILQATFTNANPLPGQSGDTFAGVVTDDAVAIGIRLADVGTGYWVVPVGVRDSFVTNASDFSLKAAFNVDDSAGARQLVAVAIGYNGSGGPQYAMPVCIEPRVPDNGHACNPTVAVPSTVFSLQWDTNFDVDLHVVTPDGTDVNAKTNPVMYPVSSGAVPKSDPKIDHDSLHNCVNDIWHQEDLIFQDAPASGAYDIYADPFESCGQAAVRFVFTIYEAQSDGSLAATYTQAGELLANDTTGGASTGLFVAEKVFE